MTPPPPRARRRRPSAAPAAAVARAARRHGLRLRIVRSRARTAVAGGALACFGAVVLAGCGSSGGKNGSLTLYSGQHEQTTALLVKAFEQDTQIKVDVRFGDEASLGNQL